MTADEQDRLWQSIAADLHRIATLLDTWLNPTPNRPPLRRYDVDDLSRPGYAKQVELQQADRDRRPR